MTFRNGLLCAQEITLWRKGDLRTIRKERRELAALQTRERPTQDFSEKEKAKEEPEKVREEEDGDDL